MITDLDVMKYMSMMTLNSVNKVVKPMKEYRFDIGVYCRIFAKSKKEAQNWAEGFANTFKDAVNSTEYGDSIDIFIDQDIDVAEKAFGGE